MEKCIKDYDPNNEQLRTEVRKLVFNGCSIKKAAKLLNIEIPAACRYVGDYDKVYNRNYMTASRKGYTKEEMEVKIAKLILDGMGFIEVGKLLNIDNVSVKRYFLNCIRARLKSDDL